MKNQQNDNQNISPKKSAINLFACAKYRNIDQYLSNCLLKFIILQVVDDFRSAKNLQIYAYQSFGKYIVDELTSYFIEQLSWEDNGSDHMPDLISTKDRIYMPGTPMVNYMSAIPMVNILEEFANYFIQDLSFQNRGPHRLLKMSTLESITCFQKNIPVRTKQEAIEPKDLIGQSKDEIRQLLIRAENVAQNRNRSELFDRLDFDYHISYSCIWEYHMGDLTSNRLLHDDFAYYFLINGRNEFLCDFLSHFFVYDTDHSCERVYICGGGYVSTSGTEYGSVITRDFVWDSEKKRWELDIFKPPYSPLFLLAIQDYGWQIYLIKKNGVDELSKNITFSYMHHWLQGHKRQDIGASNFLSIYDDEYYVHYNCGGLKLIRKWANFHSFY